MNTNEKKTLSGFPLYTILIERSTFILIFDVMRLFGTCTMSSGMSVSTMIITACAELDLPGAGVDLEALKPNRNDVYGSKNYEIILVNCVIIIIKEIIINHYLRLIRERRSCA